MPGGNKFFRGGPIISEILVPGGTNFRGVQIKSDCSCHVGDLSNRSVQALRTV